MDNLYRKIWKKIVVATQGTMQYLTEVQFEKEYLNMVILLNKFKVICCSTMYVDAQIYTEQTIKNYIMANNFLHNLNKSHPNIIGFADLFNLQMKAVTKKHTYDDLFFKDHFHPNEQGYRKISHVLGELIASDLQKV